MSKIKGENLLHYNCDKTAIGFMSVAVLSIYIVLMKRNLLSKEVDA
ncbi:MAG: hypothetical protein AAGU75_03955 [Bacillota bacterium]